ncbi:IclR family transcriptional regulator [Paraburkholderia sp.]|uniref:IclR family transcriptional regulator n=1 Tax=Paraburkholderia sp. TaxID=1926495 RepID=UPI0039E64934
MKEQPPPSNVEPSIEASPSAPIEKLFAVLTLLGNARRPMTLSELAATLGTAKTTLHRITTQLERLGYLQREPGTRFLLVARPMVDLAVSIVSTATITGRRHAILRGFCEKVGESVTLGMRVGDEIAYLDDVTTEAGLMLKIRTGLRAPMHCTSIGKLFLAHMDEQEWQDYAMRPLQRFTEKTLTDIADLRRQLDEIRRTDFALSDEEFVRGVIGAAVPVYDGSRRLLAGLSISAPAARMTSAQLRKLKPVFSDVAQEIATTFKSGQSGET